ncbi:MAG: histidine kinase, partial [Tannerella sp.]|nr:histidine kinase [Tannerella sp.]
MEKGELVSKRMAGITGRIKLCLMLTLSPVYGKAAVAVEEGQTAWFLTAIVAFLTLAGAGIALYIQRRRNRILLEKLRTEKELNELRISSIRLKAIPHFNANVLAAIEYYIANRTKEEAMRLLGIYSDFTFKTLSEVDRAARPLSEELAYVKMYLDLEKIRFLDKFDFR